MTHDKILHMRIAPVFKEVLDELRKLEKDLPSRSEMVRRLIARAARHRAAQTRALQE
jgi:hypothetical protein